MIEGSEVRGGVANLLGSLAVLLATLMLAAGLPLVNKSIEGTRDAAGHRYEFNGASLKAPPNTTLTVGAYHEDSGRIELAVGGVNVRATAREYDRGVETLAGSLIDELLAQPGVQLAQQRQCQTDEGIVGSGQMFTSPSTTGFICAFVHNGIGTDLIASGSNINSHTLDLLDELVGSLRFEGRR